MGGRGQRLCGSRHLERGKGRWPHARNLQRLKGLPTSILNRFGYLLLWTCSGAKGGSRSRPDADRLDRCRGPSGWQSEVRVVREGGFGASVSCRQCNGKPAADGSRIRGAANSVVGRSAATYQHAYRAHSGRQQRRSRTSDSPARRQGSDAATSAFAASGRWRSVHLGRN